MKSKQYRVFFGLLALVAIIGIASETTIMTASAQSTITRHCTAYRPCYNICGDHICAPGELAQMKAQSAQPQSNNTGASIAPVNSTMTTQSTGVIIGGVVSYMDISFGWNSSNRKNRSSNQWTNISNRYWIQRYK